MSRIALPPTSGNRKEEIMNFAVRYYSKNGSTKRVAQAMAETLDVVAKEIGVPLSEKVDILFLGSGVYNGKVHPSVKTFIESLDRKKVGKVVLFLTSAMTYEKAVKEVEQTLLQKKIHMHHTYFHCKGRFLIFYLSHPHPMDIQNARAFAKQFYP